MINFEGDLYEKFAALSLCLSMIDYAFFTIRVGGQFQAASALFAQSAKVLLQATS